MNKCTLLCCYDSYDLISHLTEIIITSAVLTQNYINKFIHRFTCYLDRNYFIPEQLYSAKKGEMNNFPQILDS